MGEPTNFKVNDDGSVTLSNQPNKDEETIVEIFEIEKAKGGVFASRRMKKRAMKYAKGAGVPVHTVEKLMLDNYPADLVNYRRTTRLIMWICFIILCVILLFILAGVAWMELDSYYHFESEAYRPNSNGDYSNVDYWYEAADRHWGYFCRCVLGCGVSLLLIVWGMIRYWRLCRKIKKSTVNE